MTRKLLINLTCILLILQPPIFLTLDNGLALTPPMGFLTWERFECNTNCLEDPDNCIGERLLMTIADAMVAEGFKDAGYEYITIDDCWPADDRDKDGKLQGDVTRFPNGMKALANYIHSKGLKFGLYEDVGRHTCAGAPGSYQHYQIDAQTFADWGVDMVKFDGCNIDASYFKTGYPMMGNYLNATGRPIYYSCEWPLYGRAYGVKPNYTEVAEVCNSWRVYGDINDAWESITSILNYYGDDEGNFSRVAGPGRWNDADMLVIGNFGLSADQERVQLGIWSLVASPLLISADVRRMRKRSKELLQNRRVLAISQDALGIPGIRIWKSEDRSLQVWRRPVTPEGSFALGFLNTNNNGYPKKMSFKLQDLGLDSPKGYNLTEIFDGYYIALHKPSQNVTVTVNPSGLQFIKATKL